MGSQTLNAQLHLHVLTAVTIRNLHIVHRLRLCSPYDLTTPTVYLYSVNRFALRMVKDYVIYEGQTEFLCITLMKVSGRVML